MEKNLEDFRYVLDLTPIWHQVIAAEGEQKASRALREAAEIVSESPAAIQLRYLQVVINSH